MKLINIFTNEIVVFGEGVVDLNKIGCKNVAEMLAAGWEDYEEPKWLRDYWLIDTCGNVVKQEEDVLGAARREIGNYFKTEEEAKKAVKKLKAWKRLKDKGFKIINYCCPLRKLYFEVDGGKFFEASGEVSEETRTDLTLLFGGED